MDCFVFLFSVFLFHSRVAVSTYDMYRLFFF